MCENNTRAIVLWWARVVDEQHVSSVRGMPIGLEEAAGLHKVEPGSRLVAGPLCGIKAVARCCRRSQKTAFTSDCWIAPEPFTAVYPIIQPE